jgi:hypothetical protein
MEKNGYAQNKLSPEQYQRYMRGLGVALILAGITIFIVDKRSV